MTEFTCAQCGRKHQVDDEMQAIRGKCACGNIIVVPDRAAVANSAVGLSESFAYDLPATPSPPVGETVKRPKCGILAATFGGGALLLSILGCVLYLRIWFSLDEFEKYVYLTGGKADPFTPRLQDGERILLSAKVLLHSSAWLALVAMVVGIVSTDVENPKKLGIWGIVLASISLVILFYFWYWTVSLSRDPFKVFF
jgi:DNA-directed RNA polymerase subunit RPC12/RpoP